MNYARLRQDPAYQQALRTDDTMNRRPASYVQQNEAHLLESYQLRDAGCRLDHLIRRVLAYDAFPEPWHLSAIKAFIEVIEPRYRRMNIPQRENGIAYIEPRLSLAARIITEADQTLARHHRPPVSSQEFRDLVTSSGFTIDAMVWDNPLYEINQNPAPFGRSHDQDRILHRFIRNYWD